MATVGIYVYFGMVFWLQRTCEISCGYRKPVKGLLVVKSILAVEEL